MPAAAPRYRHRGSRLGAHRSDYAGSRRQASSSKASWPWLVKSEVLAVAGYGVVLGGLVDVNLLLLFGGGCWFKKTSREKIPKLKVWLFLWVGCWLKGPIPRELGSGSESPGVFFSILFFGFVSSKCAVVLLVGKLNTKGTPFGVTGGLREWIYGPSVGVCNM